MFRCSGLPRAYGSGYGCQKGSPQGTRPRPAILVHVKVHLVDATFELFRAYYSPGRSLERGPDGRPVNAVRGLIDSMLSLLREPDVTHVAAATDYVIESWRNDVFPTYKSSAGMDPDLLA